MEENSLFQENPQQNVQPERLSAPATNVKLVTALDSDAIGRSPVTNYLSQGQFPLTPCDPCQRPPKIVIDEAVSDSLEKLPFSSIRKLATFSFIPTTTIHQHLTGSHQFAMKHLGCVGHSPTETQRVQGHSINTGR
jgi:hypothetical protein